MRKPIVALGLVVSTSFGAIPVAEVAAATSTGSNLSTSPHNSQLSTKNSCPTATSSLCSSGSTAPSNTVSGAAIVQTALKYLGDPYSATGTSPSTGFSCIGFASFVYRQNGIPLPGDLQDAYNYAPQVPFSDLQPGDLLFFQNTIWPGISHVAIYIGGGRFVHAEWYGYGVRISSFYNDPRDGNYWIGKYLGANRPWGGADVGTVVSTAQPTSGVKSTTPTTSTQSRVANGPTAIVTVAVHVRLHPSLQAGIQTVAAQGTTVIILAKRGGWYKVQLPDGTVGWIVAAGIGQSVSPSTTVVNGSTGVAPTVGNPTAPNRQSAPVQAVSLSTRVNAGSLRVHDAPSLTATVTTTVYRGQTLEVLARSNGWVKVELPNGTVGWVSAQYVGSGSRSSAQTSAPSTSSTQPPTSRTSSAQSATNHTSTSTVSTSTASFSGGSVSKYAVNVHTGPALGATVETVIPAGGRYRVLGWSNGWAHVQLPKGMTGWVSGTVIGGQAATMSPGHRSRSQVVRPTNGTARHVLTAGVRVHAGPGLGSRVVALAAAGTHVTILAYHAGWVLVRLPSGQTGYVYGAYVR